MGTHAIHEHPIVGDKDKRPLVGHEKVFQPLHRFNVEVVGRLVQQQNVGPGHQHAGKLGALAPAAGKPADGQEPFVLGKAKARKHGARLVLRAVAVQRLQFGLPRRKTPQRRLVPGADGGVPRFPKLMPRRQDIHDPVQEGAIQIGFVQILLHIAHPAAPGHDHPPGVRRFHPGQHLDQRRFAAAVRPADAQAHAGIDIQRKVGKNVAPAKGLGEVLNGDLHAGSVVASSPDRSDCSDRSDWPRRSIRSRRAASCFRSRVPRERKAFHVSERS